MGLASHAESTRGTDARKSIKDKLFSDAEYPHGSSFVYEPEPRVKSPFFAINVFFAKAINKRKKVFLASPHTFKEDGAIWK